MTDKLYKREIAKKRVFIGFLVLGLILMSIFGILIGSIGLSLGEVLETLLGSGTKQAKAVIYNIRLPRVVSAILIGAALSVSGAVMQCVLDNPLASASTLGVSQGAAFGAALGIVIFGGGMANQASTNFIMEINHPYIVTLSAFFFGFLSTLVVLFISIVRRDLGPSGLVLAGVALSSLFLGGNTLLQYFADENKLTAVVFWTFGNLGSPNWKQLRILFIVLIFVITYFYQRRWDFNSMLAGEDLAKTLGIRTRRLTLISMALCSLIASLAVSFGGIISFIGLVGPHITRIFTGDDYRYLIPGSALMGSLVLLLADSFAKTIIAPVILPIGAITSFAGAPIFLFLLVRRGRN